MWPYTLRPLSTLRRLSTISTAHILHMEDLVLSDSHAEHHQLEGSGHAVTEPCNLPISFTDKITVTGVTRAWLPIPARLIPRFIGRNHSSDFLRFQNNILSSHWSLFMGEHGQQLTFPVHFSFKDGDDLVLSLRQLGQGGFGTVDEVTLPTKPEPLVCARKRFIRPKHPGPHKKSMETFIREVMVMAQVDNYHCVRLVGSYTDYKKLAIFSQPVADMDLATMLDMEDTADERKSFLRRSVGCLCSALTYLHAKQIRSVVPLRVLLPRIEESCPTANSGCQTRRPQASERTDTGRQCATDRFRLQVSIPLLLSMLLCLPR